MFFFTISFKFFGGIANTKFLLKSSQLFILIDLIKVFSLLIFTVSILVFNKNSTPLFIRYFFQILNKPISFGNFGWYNE